jgi:spermidine synthase
MHADTDLDVRLPAWTMPVVLALFFSSGAAGLVYEVVWTRLLLNVFGATLYAVSTVLAAFMGGLALGSLVGGRVADRLRRPLAAYGVVEVAVAATALAVPFVLDLLDPLYGLLYARGESPLLLLSVVRFMVSFAVLLIPTTCMGATLPLLARFVARRREELGGRIGALYALNTTGAVTGTFLAGFVLLAALGVWGSMVAAACASLAVGVVSLAISPRLEGDQQPLTRAPVDHVVPPPAADGLPRWVPALVIGTYGLAGFASLSFQVLWSRALVFNFDVLKATTYSFSAMLTVFLVGLAGGAALMSPFVGRLRDPMRAYGLLLVLTGLAGSGSLVVLLGPAGFLQLAEPIAADGTLRWGVEVGNIFLRTAATILPPTLLMGMLFPVAARLAVRRVEDAGAVTGRLYAANTAGAIVGSFAAGFLLIPVTGLAGGLLALGALYVILGTVVLLANPAEMRSGRLVWAAVGIAAAAVPIATATTDAPFQRVFPGHRIVVDEDGELAYREGPLATVAVMESTIGHRTIYIDNVSVAGTDRILLTDQKSLAHVPMALLESPRAALTVGFGSGGASWSFLQYDEIERVDCVEISPTVPLMAHTLRASNHGVLDAWDRRSSLVGQRFWDGRFRVILDDVRSYLQFTDLRYDIIATDCTDLRYKSNANLYDVEYFELCKRRITDDGLVVVWMPLGGMTEEVFAVAMRTFSHVFPDMTVWYMANEPTHYLLLLGGNRPFEVDLDRVVERMSRPRVEADLREVSLHQPAKLLTSFLTTAPDIDGDLAALDDRLNTEDHPVLEFESPKAGLADEPLLTNLELLRRHRRSIVPRLVDAGDHPGLVEQIDRFEKAADLVLAGHAAYRRLAFTDAAALYSQALAITPDDDSLRHLLTFDDLRRRVAMYPEDAWSRVSLAEVALVRGDVDEAGALFTGAYRLLADVAATPTQRELFARAVAGVAECFERVGDTAGAERVRGDHAPLLEAFNAVVVRADSLRPVVESEPPATLD